MIKNTIGMEILFGGTSHDLNFGISTEDRMKELEDRTRRLEKEAGLKVVPARESIWDVPFGSSKE